MLKLEIDIIQFQEYSIFDSFSRLGLKVYNVLILYKGYGMLGENKNIIFISFYSRSLTFS